jgi:hypothetical protein
MDNLIIEGSKKTPYINFDKDSGIFHIKGRSVPENSYEFYNPLLVWMDEYAKQPNSSIILKIELDYFNTSSSKFLFEIFKKLKTIVVNNNSEIKVEWYYDDGDEEMENSGQDFMDILDIPFSFICISNE